MRKFKQRVYIKIRKFNIQENRIWQKKKYEQDKLWYDHIVGKQDFIHQAKTEGLFHLIERMKYHIPDMKIQDSKQGDFIQITLENKKRKTLK